jgi:hypothetical protein
MFQDSLARGCAGDDGHDRWPLVESSTERSALWLADLPSVDSLPQGSTPDVARGMGSRIARTCFARLAMVAGESVGVEVDEAVAERPGASCTWMTRQREASEGLPRIASKAFTSGLVSGRREENRHGTGVHLRLGRVVALDVRLGATQDRQRPTRRPTSCSRATGRRTIAGARAGAGGAMRSDRRPVAKPPGYARTAASGLRGRGGRSLRKYRARSTTLGGSPARMRIQETGSAHHGVLADRAREEPSPTSGHEVQAAPTSTTPSQPPSLLSTKRSSCRPREPRRGPGRETLAECEHFREKRELLQ